jgi:hypothetical protein
MELTNITYIRDTQEVILYFGNHRINVPATWQTYNLYCEFKNIPIARPEVRAVDITELWAL